MASYPDSLVTYTDPAGTTRVDTGVDHAVDHTSLHAEVIALETAMGTTAGTNIHKNFAAGQFPARINASNVFQHIVTGTVNTSILGTPAITGGTMAAGAFNTGTVGTPTVIGGTVAVSGTVTPLSFGAAIAPTVVTLDDSPGGTIVPNAQAGQVFHLIFAATAGNRTMGTPLNAATDGQILRYRIKQNAAANGTLLWAATAYRMSEMGSPTIGTASSYNYYNFSYNAIDSVWDFVGQSKNLN